MQTPPLSSHARIPAPGISLAGDLHLPATPAGLIVFATAGENDSWRVHEPEVQALLESRGYGTLTVDLLTASEAMQDRDTGEFHLDTDFLADRFCTVLAWIGHQPDLRRLGLGVFLEGMASAAALRAAPHHADQISAIVSRSGRADLAEASLERVTTPTLLIAEASDGHVLDLNREASARIAAPHRLEVLSEADREGGGVSSADLVAARTAEWFDHYLHREAVESRVAITP
jgi:putative phosphoribosyl transferase